MNDLIAVSRIDRVIEEKAYKKAVNYSEIKTTLHTIINADSEKRRKTLIRVHLSTSPEAEWSVVHVTGAAEDQEVAEFCLSTKIW